VVAQQRKRLTGNALLAIGAGICAVVVLIAVVSLHRFTRSRGPSLPPPPPVPPEQNVGRVLRRSPEYYKASIEEDAKRFGVKVIEPAEMARPLAWAVELSQPRALDVRHGAMETAHLRIGARVIKEWASSASGQRFRYEHVVLSITNKSERPVAYLIETAVNHPERCRSQGAMFHNALALTPGEKTERTECLWHKDTTLVVKHVEVIELSPLGFYYVSRLNPIQLSLDARTATGHAVPKPAKECAFVPWRDIQASAAEAHTGWADVIDFYARHNCDEYSYWRGYRRWTAPGTLPSLPPAAASPGEPVDQPAASK
jgi:hypothetical protein